MNSQVPQQPRAFTLVELLVTMVLCASFFTAAALVHQSYTQNRTRTQAFEEVTLTEAILANFYDFEERSTVNVHTAPSYGWEAPTADVMRERFWEDVERSAGAFPLPRVALNTVRPTSITVPSGMTGGQIEGPADFRALLVSANASADTIYGNMRNFSTTTWAPWTGGSALSGTVYVLQSSSTEDALGVRSIWEIDMISTTSPSGTFASVRRYVGSTRTDYYHVFYPDVSCTDFGPLFVAFERRAGLNLTEADADKFKKAKNDPFFFMWWPDPALQWKNDAPPTAVYNPSSPAADDPRIAYYKMGMRSACFFVVSIFPAF